MAKLAVLLFVCLTFSCFSLLPSFCPVRLPRSWWQVCFQASNFQKANSQLVVICFIFFLYCFPLLPTRCIRLILFRNLPGLHGNSSADWCKLHRRNREVWDIIMYSVLVTTLKFITPFFYRRTKGAGYEFDNYTLRIQVGPHLVRSMKWLHSPNFFFLWLVFRFRHRSQFANLECGGTLERHSANSRLGVAYLPPKKKILLLPLTNLKLVLQLRWANLILGFWIPTPSNIRLTWKKSQNGMHFHWVC